jgi:hypothetical protein
VNEGPAIADHAKADGKLPLTLKPRFARDALTRPLRILALSEDRETSARSQRAAELLLAQTERDCATSAMSRVRTSAARELGVEADAASATRSMGALCLRRHRRVGQGRELVGGYFRFDLAK